MADEDVEIEKIHEGTGDYYQTHKINEIIDAVNKLLRENSGNTGNGQDKPPK